MSRAEYMNFTYMRSHLFLLFGSVVLLLGCADHPEVSTSAYGTVLETLPDLKDAEAPFPFPAEGDNNHQNCVFNEEDFF